MYGLTDVLLAAGQNDIASFHLNGQAARLNRPLPASDRVRLLVFDTTAAFAGSADCLSLAKAGDFKLARPS